MKTNLHLLTGILATCTCIIVAQTPDNNRSAAEDAARSAEQKNAIFSTILQSMPTDMQKRIDSASTASTKNEVHEGAKTNVAEKQGASEQKQHALDELPAEVRAKVQQRMTEIENNNEKRTIQLKEQIIEQKRKQTTKQ